MLSAMQAARAEASEMCSRGRELPKPVLAAALKLMHVVVPKRRRSFSRSRLPVKRALTTLALLPHQPLRFSHNRRGRKRFFHDVLLLLDVNFVGPGSGACRQGTAHIFQAPVLCGDQVL